MGELGTKQMLCLKASKQKKCIMVSDQTELKKKNPENIQRKEK